MKNYLGLMQKIMTFGEDRQGRNAVTRALFAEQLTWDMRAGFPLVTTKKVPFKSVTGELLWFLSGSTNDNDLKKIMDYPPEKPTIWSANANDPNWIPRRSQEGDLGRIYGKQWRSWQGASWLEELQKWTCVQVDQIYTVVERIKKDPFDRRLIVTSWNPADLNKMSLPACHVMFQFYCGADDSLSLSMIQRSCDYFLGVPFNIASYALLTQMVAQQTELEPGDFIWTGGDCHIYDNHLTQVREQLSREPYPFPRLHLRPAPSLFDYTFDDVEVLDYRHHPAIKAPVAV